MSGLKTEKGHKKAKTETGKITCLRFGADGEICAFGGAPRKTADVRCFVCVPTLLSPFCRTQTARSRSHLHPQISPVFKGKTKAAGRTKSFPPLWRGWRDLRLWRRAPENSGCPLFCLRSNSSLSILPHANCSLPLAPPPSNLASI